jgi:hypothetical protein
MTTALRMKLKEALDIIEKPSNPTSINEIKNILISMKDCLGKDPEKYSAEWLKELVKEKRYSSLGFRECSICNKTLHYIFVKDEVFYQSSCACSSWSPPRPRSYEDIAHTLRLQSTDELRDTILSRLEI